MLGVKVEYRQTLYPLSLTNFAYSKLYVYLFKAIFSLPLDIQGVRRDRQLPILYVDWSCSCQTYIHIYNMVYLENCYWLLHMYMTSCK